MYKFLERLSFLNCFRMLGHQAASNAPLTSRLTITVHCFNLKLSYIKFLTSFAASTVPLWGVNPY
jgi:hypothetical protein